MKNVKYASGRAVASAAVLFDVPIFHFLHVMFIDFY